MHFGKVRKTCCARAVVPKASTSFTYVKRIKIISRTFQLTINKNLHVNWFTIQFNYSVIITTHFRKVRKTYGACSVVPKAPIIYFKYIKIISRILQLTVNKRTILQFTIQYSYSVTITMHFGKVRKTCGARVVVSKASTTCVKRVKIISCTFQLTINKRPTLQFTVQYNCSVIITTYLEKALHTYLAGLLTLHKS